MSACKYRVVGVAIEPSLRGDEMRRLTLRALPSEPMGETPDGTIVQLVTPEFAKRFSVGDEFDVMFREREKD